MSKEYIERDAVRDMLHSEIESWGSQTDEINALLGANDRLFEIPAADVVEVKHGEWEFGELDVLGAPVKCSRCGFGVDRADPILWLDYDGHKFCGNCGAKMDGGADNG